MEKVWLIVSYPVDFTIGIDGSWSWRVVGSTCDKGKSHLVSVPKNVSFVELYHKLEQKLKIDARIYEMVLRCPYPIASKDPFPPCLIEDDDSVEWLISRCDKVPLCVTLKLKTNDSSVGVDDRPVGVDVNGVSLLPRGTFDNSHMYMTPKSENLMDEIGVVDNVSSIPCRDAENMVVDDMNAIELPGLTDVDRRGGGFFVSCEPLVSTVRIPLGEDIQSKALFESKRHLKDKIEMLAVTCHFVFTTTKSDKTIYRVRCRNKGCMWRLAATRLGDSKVFQVRKYECPHSCSLTMNLKDHPNASYKMVARLFADKFQDLKGDYKTKDVIHDFLQQFGYELLYTKAHNARTYAMKSIQGNPKES